LLFQLRFTLELLLLHVVLRGEVEGPLGTGGDAPGEGADDPGTGGTLLLLKGGNLLLLLLSGQGFLLTDDLGPFGTGTLLGFGTGHLCQEQVTARTADPCGLAGLRPLHFGLTQGSATGRRKFPFQSGTFLVF